MEIFCVMTEAIGSEDFSMVTTSERDGATLVLGSTGSLLLNDTEGKVDLVAVDKTIAS